MKYLSLIASLFFLISVSAQSQQISISPVTEHSENNQNTFPVKNGVFSIHGNQFEIGGKTIINPASWSVADAGGKFGFLEQRGEIYLKSVDYNGVNLFEKPLEFFDPDDETVKVYQFDDGRLALRDNVANFTFVNPKGSQLFSVSNSSQSEYGERESQLARDKNGRTVVLYNPVIAYGNQTGSQARLVFGDQDNLVFFDDVEREISYLDVSRDGAFITIIAANGSDDQVLIFDRFGNEIYRLDVDYTFRGAVLSKGAQYLTVYSSGRVQAFEIPSGELMGSASSQATIIYAAYQPEDETIIALGGSYDGQNISNPTLTAVHLGRRELIREEIPYSISAYDVSQIAVERNGTGLYRLTGLNMHLDLSIQF